MIVITRFQLQSLGEIWNTLDEVDETRVAYASIIPDEEINLIFHNAMKLRYDIKSLQLIRKDISTRVREFFANPRNVLLSYRQFIERNKTVVKQLFDGVHPDSKTHIVIFNDRDFLTQSTLVFVKDWRNLTVTAVDEGLGYYVKERLKERFMKVVYSIVTPPVLGFHYRFIERYGTHPMIDEVFLRFPDLVIKNSDRVRYRKIEPIITQNRDKYRCDLEHPAVLLLSTVLSEENFTSRAEEFEFHQFLAKHLEKCGISLVWRPHPREDINKVKAIDALYSNVMKERYAKVSNSIQAEAIEFSDYKLILNFGSTLLLFILQSGFPAEQIVTLNVTGLDLQIRQKTTNIKFASAKRPLELMFRKLSR